MCQLPAPVAAGKPAAPGLEANLVSRPVPPFKSRVEGSVQSLDWRLAAERERACELLVKHGRGDADGPRAPLLIKHAVEGWPALQTWTLDRFQQDFPDLRTWVRCAPSMRFYYTEPQLLRHWRRWHRLTGDRDWLPPTHGLAMRMADFLARLQPDCSLPRAFYPADRSQHEFCYAQTMLHADMLADVDLYSPPLSCLGRPGMPGKGEEGQGFAPPEGMPIAQVPRMFVSPGGAISPLHYDTASSFLAQVRGRKRLLFYAPEALPRLYPHHRLHYLRRRARVDPADPDLARFPRFAGLAASEACLDPGDVLWFPGYWSHYTESQTSSISMTYRFWSEEQKARNRRGILGLLSV